MEDLPLNLVIALPAEAKPLRRYYGLQRDQQHTRFPLYRNGRMRLVLSGPGKEAAREAATWLHTTSQPEADTLWINVGIAGHPERPVGQVVVANTIEDQTSGITWATQLPGRPAAETARIITLDGPDPGYRHGGVVDMEAAGFYRAALAFAEPRRIGCIKVISDNREQPADRINGKWVSGQIEDRMDLLHHLFKWFEAGTRNE